MSQELDIYFSPRWMSLRQAAEYCPLGQKRLIDLAKKGEIKGGQHGGTKAWFFDRRSIDQYMDSLCIRHRVQKIENNVVEFLKGIG